MTFAHQREGKMREKARMTDMLHAALLFEAGRALLVPGDGSLLSADKMAELIGLAEDDWDALLRLYADEIRRVNTEAQAQRLSKPTKLPVVDLVSRELRFAAAGFELSAHDAEALFIVKQEGEFDPHNGLHLALRWLIGESEFVYHSDRGHVLSRRAVIEAVARLSLYFDDGQIMLLVGDAGDRFDIDAVWEQIDALQLDKILFEGDDTFQRAWQNRHPDSGADDQAYADPDLQKRLEVTRRGYTEGFALSS